MLIFPEKSSHWYKFKDGKVEPCYEIPATSGKGMRAPTVKDARELGLLPSVTKVVGVLNKPALTLWLQEQAILSALTLPRLPEEQEDAFAHRCIEDMGKRSEDAKDFGSRVHKGIEAMFKGQQPEEDVAPWVRSVKIWADENKVTVNGTEMYVGDENYGYAGRLDLFCEMGEEKRLAVVDFKTQQLKNGKAKFWPEWPLQLAAYGCASVPQNENLPLLVSVIIPTAEPGPVHMKIWDDPQEHFRLFECCLVLWRYLNSYPKEAANEAYDCAEAMLAEREKRNNNNNSTKE